MGYTNVHESNQAELVPCPGYKYPGETFILTASCPELNRLSGGYPGGTKGYPEEWDASCPTCRDTAKVASNAQAVYMPFGLRGYTKSESPSAAFGRSIQEEREEIKKQSTDKVSPSRFHGKKLANRVEHHTQQARERWDAPNIPYTWERDRFPKQMAYTVLMEEVGKLGRCINKLFLLDSDSEDDQAMLRKWNEEAEHRIITSMSMLRRMHETWGELPNR